VTAPTPPSVRRYVVGLTLASAAALAVSAWLALRGAPYTWQAAAIAAGLGLSIFILQRRGLVLHWSGQRTITTIDEPAVMLALLLLPAGVAPFLVALGVLGVQLVARRTAIKRVFNVAAYSLAAALATGVHLALLTVAPPLVASAIAIVVYTLTSMLAVSALFARLEGGRTLRVFRSRFGRTAPVHASLGGAGVVVGVALWTIHPLALVAVVPFLVMGLGFIRVDARSQREVFVRARLADTSAALGVHASEAEVAQRVVDTCGDVFLAGEATLTLDGPGASRAWRREFEGGAAPGAAPLSAPLVAPDGRAIGRLDVYPARRAHRVQAVEVDQHLITIVAGQAASAISAARALAEILEVTRHNESIVGHAPAGILSLDAAGRVTQLNTQLVRALGADDDPRGRPAAEWEPLAQHAALVDATLALVAGVPFYDLELAPVMPGGPWLSASGVPLEGGLGSVILLADVSVHKRAEEALRSQTLTRPFVRRLVLSIVARMSAPPQVIAEVGRGLAGELKLDSPEDFASAFRALGLGDLRFVRRDGDTFRFVADDLLERQQRSRMPTCHLALGFVEGGVAAFTGAGSLGSELRCQSQGHAHCEFVVQRQELPVKRASARRANASKAS
jgi:predicted hydrocarbon binding protein/PAS domain-containing protein